MALALSEEWREPSPQRTKSPYDSVGAFVAIAAMFRLLTREEEIRVSRSLWQHSTREKTKKEGTIVTITSPAGYRARDVLVLANLKLVLSVSKKLLHRGLAHEDLLDEGVIGLQRAAELFDPEKGWKFSTYATWWIRQSMKRAIAEQSRTIRLPVYLQEQRGQIRGEIARLAREHGRTIKIGEAAEGLGLSEERVRSVFSAFRPIDSLDRRIGDSDDTSDLHQMVKDREAVDPYDAADSLVKQDAIKAELALHMPPLQVEAVWLFLGEGLMIKDIAQQLGISFNQAKGAVSMGKKRLFERKERFEAFL